MRKLIAVSCALTFALVAAGCGSSGGSDGSGSTTTTTKASATTTTTNTTKGSATTTTTDASETTTTVAGDDGGDPGDADGYAASLVTSLTSGSKENGDLVITEEQAECVAPKIVELVTVEGFTEADISVDDAAASGFDPEDLGLDEGQGQELFDAFGACDVDLVAQFAESITIGLDDEQAACAAENVDAGLVEALLVKSFSTGESDAEFDAVLADLETTCQLPTN
ncbi:MAG: hypothetical protein JWO77_946 [Ilumatobacteraceae bacterium]|nr:hypothetical protein [Ilumatobacteraceae bacterium]